jgi:hypothetical protein
MARIINRCFKHINPNVVFMQDTVNLVLLEMPAKKKLDVKDRLKHNGPNTVNWF